MDLGPEDEFVDRRDEEAGVLEEDEKKSRGTGPEERGSLFGVEALFGVVRLVLDRLLELDEGGVVSLGAPAAKMRQVREEDCVGVLELSGLEEEEHEALGCDGRSEVDVDGGLVVVLGDALAGPARSVEEVEPEGVLEVRVEVFEGLRHERATGSVKMFAFIGFWQLRQRAFCRSNLEGLAVVGVEVDLEGRGRGAVFLDPTIKEGQEGGDHPEMLRTLLAHALVSEVFEVVPLDLGDLVAHLGSEGERLVDVLDEEELEKDLRLELDANVD